MNESKNLQGSKDVLTKYPLKNGALVGSETQRPENEKRVRKKEKLHNLTGIIISKEPYKVYHKDSPYHGNLCYKVIFRKWSGSESAKQR